MCGMHADLSWESDPCMRDSWANYRHDWDTHRPAMEICRSAMKLAKERFKYIGSGTTRKVFRAYAEGDSNSRDVLKFPSCPFGILHNFSESERYAQGFDDFPIARSVLDQDLSRQYGVPILRMEYVGGLESCDLPDWAFRVDSAQVGRTVDGRIVAYDYADNCEEWIFKLRWV